MLLYHFHQSQHFLKFETELFFIELFDVFDNKFVTLFLFFRNAFPFSAEYVVDKVNSK